MCGWVGAYPPRQRFQQESVIGYQALVRQRGWETEGRRAVRRLACCRTLARALCRNDVKQTRSSLSLLRCSRGFRCCLYADGVVERQHGRSAPQAKRMFGASELPSASLPTPGHSFSAPHQRSESRRMRPFLTNCPNHGARPKGPLWAVFCLSRPTFSIATEPRPFWLSCAK
jgi:hypothetical protein